MTIYGNISLGQQLLSGTKPLPEPFISEVLWQSPESNFKAIAQATILYDEIQTYSFKIIGTSPRGQ